MAVTVYTEPTDISLTWDVTGEHFYEAGVDHGVLFPLGTDGAYEKGVVWNGLTSVTESPSGGDPNDMYADNIKYLSMRAAEDFGGTIEAYTYPDEFAECDGSASVAGVSIGQQARKKFGFVYRTRVGSDASDDLGYKYHIVYNAQVSPSERAYETINDSPEAINFSWEFTTIPVPVGAEGLKPTSHMEIDTTKLTAEQQSKLTALLKTIYGTKNGSGTAAEAHLPSPLEVLTAMGYTAS